MSIDHILASITNTPLLITPDKLAVIMDVLGNRQHISMDFGKLEGLVPAASAAAPIARPVHKMVAVNIATVSMVGSMVNRSAAGSSGMVNYRGIKRQLDRAIADPDIGGILLDIDSHGGMAAGAHRLAVAIHEAAEIKPIYGFVDNSAYSAGYYLPGGCTKIILADESAGVGSIGAIAMHRDQSAHNEKEGFVYTAIFSGARKADYNPHQPLPEGLAAEIQKSVDKSRYAFAGAVAKFRGLAIEAVLDTEAMCFYGKDAITAGLVDEIATLEEAEAMLVEEIIERASLKTTQQGGSEMTTQERLEALISNNDDAPEALANLGYVPTENATDDEALANARQEGVTAGLAQAGEVLAVADLGGVTVSMAATMVAEGLTQEGAMAAVQQHRADNSAGTHVASTITTLSGDGKHPLISACEKLA